MKTVFKIAFKNILSYRWRSLTVFFSILVSIIIFTFIQGFLNGFTELISTSIFNNLGHLVIQHEEYEKKADLLSVKYMITHYTSVKQHLQNLDGIASINGEIQLGASLSTDESSIEMMGRAIEPDSIAYNYFKNHMVEGTMFAHPGGICISRYIAELLNVQLGESLMILSSTAYESFNVKEVTIRGLFEADSTEINENVFIMPLQEAWQLLQVNDVATAIEIKLFHYKDSVRIAEMINQTIQHNDALRPLHLKAYAWQELYPEMVQMVSMGSLVIFMMFLLIVLVVGAGIVNSILMSVFERFRDFGTIRAIGFKKIHLFFLVIIENAIIGTVASILGVIIGAAIVHLLSINGIDLGSGMEQFKVVSNILYPKLSSESALLCLTVGFVVSVVGSIIPGYSAAKLKIVDIMRYN